MTTHDGGGRAAVLCADEESRRHPELIGLAGESLDAQSWLAVVSSGAEARELLREEDGGCEAWVASSDDVDPINLAAAIKRDRSDRTVLLVSEQGTGSLRSRAGCAGIDAVIGIAELAARYGALKRAAVSQRESAERQASWQNPSAQQAPRQDPPAQQVPRQGGTLRQGGAATHPPLAFSVPAVSVSSQRPAAPPDASQRPAAPPDASQREGGQAFVMPVVSGSGGAGKSTVSVLAAIIAQGAGYRTVLVDFDLQFGDVLALMGRDDALRVDEAAASPVVLERLRPDGSFPAVLAAPRRLERAEEVAEQVGALMAALEGSFEVVVANTGSFWAEQHAALLERSAKALFLVDQRPSSLRACQHALELCARCGIATGPFAFAANRCSRSALYTSLDVSCALRGAHAFELADGGREVEELLAAGQPFELVEGGNALCESIADALAELVPGWDERTEAGGRPAPLMRRIFGGRRGRGRAACL